MSCSRPTMAKDVIKKKQRIAHNKANEGHEMYPDCNDFLSSIMQDMDNNDLMACLGNFQNNLPETSKISYEKMQTVNQIPNRNHMSLPKLKKFGLSRKGPLMAKSQRTLQQLQHNRKLPKPRAHLAGLSNSHADLSVSQSFHNTISSQKFKAKDVNNAKSSKNKYQNKVATEKQIHNTAAIDGNKKRISVELKSRESTSKKLKPSVMDKKFPAKSNHTLSLKNVSKMNESAIIKRKSSTEKSSHEIHNCDKSADNSSDSDEYEKFIRKEKKDLPKKSKKKISNNVKSLKKVSRKRASKSVSTESESDLTDEDSSNSYKSKKMRKTHNMLDNRQSINSVKDKLAKKVGKKRNSRAVLKYVSPSSDSEMSEGPSTSYKKRKKIHKKLNERSPVTSKENSESEMDINNETYHNSSSESDDLPSPSEIMQGLPSVSNRHSGQMSNKYKSELSLHSNKAYNIPSVVSRDEPNILRNETSHEIPNTALDLSNDQPNVFNKSSDVQTLVGSAQQNLSCKILNVASKSNDQPNILQNQSSLYEIPSVMSSGQPNALHKSSVALHKSSVVHSLVGSAQPNVSHLSSVGSVHANVEHIASQNNSVSNNSHKENSSKSIIVDLVESDNECESSFTVIPKIVKTSSQNQNDSEESEIELVDVIVPDDLPVSTECSDKNDACTKNNSNDLNIKTEKADISHSIAKPQNTKLNPESQASISKKYEVAYTTGICQNLDEESESKDKIRKQLNLNNEKSKPEDKIVKQLNLNNELGSSIFSTVKDSVVLNKVKIEPCDDLEIILDTASPTNSAVNLPNKEISRNTGIKVEKAPEAVKLAIHNIKENPVSTRKSSVLENAKDLLILNKKVKKEPSDGDECEIILDTTSTSNSSTNLPNVLIHSNTNIKVERDSNTVKQASAIHITNDDPIGSREDNKLTEKVQKFHEIPSSTLTNLTSSHNMVQPTANELQHTFSIKALLENLKKEFLTYQEILVTEQSVESTFKILEKCQAERLKSLKTKIIQCLESAPSSSDCDSIKFAVNKLLDSSELSNSTSFTDGKKISSMCSSESSSTSDISMQDLKTFANMNIVPLSSISEKDIKPDVLELQRVVKQEQSPSYDMNSMSFGEKCIVCAKDASAACQQCAKVFFCSNECGRKYWEDGHKNNCIK